MEISKPVFYEYSDASNIKNKTNLDFFQFDYNYETRASIVPANSSNLMVSYVEICEDDNIILHRYATSHIFYVIKGFGETQSDDHKICWQSGDIFVLPYYEGGIYNHAFEHSVLFWVNDSILLEYLGCAPRHSIFNTCYFRHDVLKEQLETLSKISENRCGILLGIPETQNTTKTITPTLWCLYNKLPKNSVQKAHKHNSIAIDFCIECKENSVYTLVGQEIGTDGCIVDGEKVYWKPGCCFITPPGLWHSHHNTSDQDAYILPIQDAGLHTHLGTLDIQFSK